jgi:hypothetical protein
MAIAHRSTDALNQADRPGHVRIDYVPGLVEILIEKAAAKAVAGVCQEQLDGPAADGLAHRVHAFHRRQVELERIDVCAELTELCRSVLNLDRIGRYQQIEAFAGANGREFVPDAR